MQKVLSNFCSEGMHAYLSLTLATLQVEDHRVYVRENGTICPSGVFFPWFINFTSKLEILNNVVFFGVWTGSFGQNSRYACKTRENATRPQLASSQGLVSKWTTDYKTGKNAKSTNGSIFTRPPDHRVATSLQFINLIRVVLLPIWDFDPGDSKWGG